MKIDVILTPGDSKNDERIKSGVIVTVIDVLRVSTTIITAMENGASSIYPVLTVQEAFDRKNQLLSEETPPESILLGGERNSLLIPGFDMGNSPPEYTREKIGGKILILSSTNGTKAVRRSKDADGIIAACIRNAQAAADFLLTQGKDVLFYLSGRIGEFSLEDSIGAGIIIGKILKSTSAELTDSAIACIDLAEKYSADPEAMFRKSYHGKYLLSLGLERDLEFCSKLDCSAVVPWVEGDRLIKKV
ncbi:MAG: 2-phosphosulfolactate phosphatase [Firmicutes bacterium]|nr:2-phosphosulfolactate phosphatase [Bacillota bacterium]